MFSIFKKDPLKKLKKFHALALEQGMHAQRNGDIKAYSKLAVEADEIYKQIVEIEAKEK